MYIVALSAQISVIAVCCWSRISKMDLKGSFKLANARDVVSNVSKFLEVAVKILYSHDFHATVVRSLRFPVARIRRAWAVLDHFQAWPCVSPQVHLASPIHRDLSIIHENRLLKCCFLYALYHMCGIFWMTKSIGCFVMNGKSALVVTVGVFSLGQGTSSTDLPSWTIRLIKCVTGGNRRQNTHFALSMV